MVQGKLIIEDSASVYYAGKKPNGIPDNIFIASADLALAFENTNICIDLSEAKSILKEYLDESSSRPRGKDTIKSLSFVDKYSSLTGEAGFFSKTVQQWTCAPSADCWWGYLVSCNGIVKQWHGGED